MKNSLDEFSSRFEMAKDTTNEVEETSIEIIQSEELREKSFKINNQSLRDLWDQIKHTNIFVIGNPEEEDIEKGIGKILGEIMAKNFQNVSETLIYSSRKL